MADTVVTSIINTIAYSPSLPREGAGRAIARDSTDRIWVSYTRSFAPFPNDWGQIGVAYSDDDGLTWSEEQITNTMGTFHFFSNLAVDSANDIHVVYTASLRAPFPARYGVFYRKREGGVWLAEETVALLDVANPGQDWPMVAIDSLDNVHVIWTGLGWGINVGNENLQHRVRIAGVWGAVDPITDVAFNQCKAAGPSFAINNSGIINLVWVGLGWGLNPGSTNIQFATNPGGVWAQEAVSDVGGLGMDTPRIALTSTGEVHITYLDQTIAHCKIEHGTRTGPGTWVIETYVPNDPTQWIYLPHIVIDKLDRLHFTWTNYTHFPNDVWYRRKEGAAWQVAYKITPAVTNDADECVGAWANWPLVGGVKIGVPDKLYAILEENSSGGGVMDGHDWFISVAPPVVTPLPLSPSVLTLPATGVT